MGSRTFKGTVVSMFGDQTSMGAYPKLKSEIGLEIQASSLLAGMFLPSRRNLWNPFTSDLLERFRYCQSLDHTS